MLKNPFKSKPKYVKFDEKYTVLTAKEESIINGIAADIREFIKTNHRVNPTGHHTRSVHSKGYGALKATFEVLDNLPEEYAQGLYAKPSKHDAVVRFSNAAASLDADRRLGMAIGLSFKVFDVPGTKLTPDEPEATNFDFALVNGPVFFTNKLEDYAYLSKLIFGLNGYLKGGAVSKAKFVFDWLTRYGKKLPDAEGLKSLNAFRKLATVKPKNPWLYDYFSQGVVRHGDYMGKIRVTPTKASVDKIIEPNINLLTEDEAIRPVMLHEIRSHDYEFDVQIQLSHDLKKQPIEELTKEWKEKEAPFVTVAKLRLPKQDIPDDGHFNVMENLSFTTFRALDENRPIGLIQQSRLQAYQASSKARHEFNQVKRREPLSLEETFSKTFY